MNDRTKHLIMTGIALLVSVIPPFVTTLYYFPLWVETSAEATLSGTVCVLGLLCLIPFGKYLVQLMRSPSAPIVWGVFTAVMFIMRSIAAQMFVVGVVGTVSNIVGTALFKYARMLAPKKE